MGLSLLNFVRLSQDLTSPKRHSLAQAAKDVGAAAVTLTALTAALMGLLMLGPPMWAQLFGE
jgi:diacylglycerol kinase